MNIHISFNDDANTEVLLNFVDFNKNGLLLYEYNTEFYDENGWLHKALIRQIYHGFKDYFHKHEYHKSSEDSLLAAYNSDIMPNIHEQNNEAIIWYCDNYKDKFNAYNKFLQSQQNEFLKFISIRDQTRQFQRYLSLWEFSLRGLGEYVYSRILIRDISGTIKFDIQNEIRRLKLLKEQIYIKISHFSFKLTAILSIIGIIATTLGILIAVLGIIIAFLLYSG